MAVLNDGEFELDGVGFGGEQHGLLVNPGGFDPGSTGWRTQDTAVAQRDGYAFGRDQKNPPLWGWDLTTNRFTAASALDELDKLAAAWDATDLRDTPGAVSTLRYNIGGRARRVYGRPRRFSITTRAPLWAGVTAAVADFQLAESVYYDDVLRTQSVGVVPTSTAGGFTFPTTFPMSTLQGGQRAGVIDSVGGSRATPVIAVISGPITNPWVAAQGWRVQFNTAIPAGKSVVIDARPHALSVFRSDGASLAGTLTRQSSRLSDLRLSPGSAELTFGGTDLTGTATCAVSWRPAFHSL